MTRFLQRALPSTAAKPWKGGSRHRRAGVAAMAVALMLNSACYAYLPLDTAPQPGTEVRLELNDRGRAALADSIGPTAHRIEGTLRSVSDSMYQLDVRSVEYFTGQIQRWAGEELRIPASYVNQSREKRFDRKRSLTVGAAALAAVVVAIVGADLVGGTTPSSPPTEPPPSNQ